MIVFRKERNMKHKPFTPLAAMFLAASLTAHSAPPPDQETSSTEYIKAAQI